MWPCATPGVVSDRELSQLSVTWMVTLAVDSPPVALRASTVSAVMPASPLRAPTTVIAPVSSSMAKKSMAKSPPASHAVMA